MSIIAKEANEQLTKSLVVARTILCQQLLLLWRGGCEKVRFAGRTIGRVELHFVDVWRSVLRDLLASPRGRDALEVGEQWVISRLEKMNQQQNVAITLKRKKKSE